MSIVTVAEVKQLSKIGFDTHDTLLQTIIDGAESYLAEIMGAAFTQDTISAEVQNGGFKQMWLNICPVVSVSKVYDTWTELDVDADDYLNDDRSVYVKYGGTWEAGDMRYEVTYVGGWNSSTIPDAVKTAIIELASRQYTNPTGKTRQSAAGYGTEWSDLLTADLMELIRPHSFDRILA